MNQPAQEGAGRDDDRPCPHLPAVTQANARDAAVRDHQLIRLTLDHAEIGGPGYRRLHRCRVELAIGLGTRATHRRSLAAIEHAELDAGDVRDPAHQAIQRIDLTNQMALAETPDRGIAGHHPDGRKPMGHQRRPGADARRGARGLAAGVAAADDDDVE